MLRSFLWILLLLLLAGCATGPKYPLAEVNQALRPDQASIQPDVVNGTKVLWGGKIAASKNLPDATQLEIIAYPLASNQSPQIDKATEGRFMIESKGYLEPLDYAIGRTVTVTGSLGEPLTGKIGEASYQYPVVTPDDLYLWPIKSEGGRIPIRFGFGFVFHN